MQENNETLELDIKSLLLLILRKSWLILLVAVLVAAIAFGYAKFFIAPQYAAKIQLYSNNIYEGNQGEIEAGQLTAAAYLAEVYMIILESKPVLNEVLKTTQLQNKYTVDQLRTMITADSINNTELFEITVTGEDSQEIVKIANTIAEVLPGKLVEVVEGSDVRLVDYAVETKQVVYPDYTKILLISFWSGFLLCAVIIVIRELADDGIHSEEYLTAFYKNIPLLAVVPDAREPKGGSYRRYKSYYKRYYRSYYAGDKKAEQNGGNEE